MMDSPNVYPKGRQRYAYLGGERSSPLASLVAARNPFTFFKPVE